MSTKKNSYLLYKVYLVTSYQKYYFKRQSIEINYKNSKMTITIVKEIICFFVYMSNRSNLWECMLARGAFFRHPPSHLL